MDNKPEWKVLLIDADEDDFIIIRSILDSVEIRKISLEWSQNSQKALQPLQQQAFDVVLIDYRLGHETGIEVIQSLAKSGIALPTILLCEKDCYDIDFNALAAGGFTYLYKIELTPQILERAIANAIAGNKG